MLNHPSDAATQLGPSLPSMSLLSEFAPTSVWQAAFEAASHSTDRLRMGAAIVGKHGIVTGTSLSQSKIAYEEGMASMHAERDALREGAHINLEGAVCVVVGVNRLGTGSPWSACPCLACATALHNRGIAEIHYPQRTADGGWMVRVETPDELLARAPKQITPNDLSKGMFAREARLASLEPVSRAPIGSFAFAGIGGECAA